MLMRSVNRLLDEGEQAHAVVVMWSRHRLFFPYAALSAAVLFAVAVVVGVETTANRIVLAGCGAAVAAMATTNYIVLADTTTALVMCRSSRVRQYAKAVVKRLPHDTPLKMTGSTVVTSDWSVDGAIYTMTKRWEATMRQLATTGR